MWPDFEAPAQYDDPDPRWVDPRLPDFRTIWRIARLSGYAVGLHGSMKRDCDLIAVAWMDDAISGPALVAHLCAQLNARQVGEFELKPHGRIAVICKSTAM